MAGAVRVRRGVARRRRVAAADVPAGEADPQMDNRAVLGPVVLAGGGRTDVPGRHGLEVLALLRRLGRLALPAALPEQAQWPVAPLVLRPLVPPAASHHERNLTHIQAR